jgi:hypothetical protein
MDPDRKFIAEAMEMTFGEYLKYMEQANEEAPLYMLDKSCTIESPLVNDFTVPEMFASDLFGVMGDKRPDYRWIIVGPARSGSAFHIDPNLTNAWNGVIKGRKKWILYPPSVTPPGVFPSSDKSEVTSPVSLAEWFMNYYSTIKKDPMHLRPIEAVCGEGELLFVPSRWWHCVMNLDDGIALSQNYVGLDNVQKVLAFCKNKPEQVAGFNCDNGAMYDVFMEGLGKHRPDVLQMVEEASQKLKTTTAKRSWSDMVAPVESSKSFEFSFES